jgi:hypothetical protein
VRRNENLIRRIWIANKPRLNALLSAIATRGNEMSWSQDAGDMAAVDDDAEDDKYANFHEDDEGKLMSAKKPTVDEMLSHLNRLDPELRAYFYGNIPGCSYRWAGSRKRRAQSKPESEGREVGEC